MMSAERNDTPRTNAAAVENPNFVKVVNAEVAREMERELNNANATLS